VVTRGIAHDTDLAGSTSVLDRLLLDRQVLIAEQQPTRTGSSCARGTCGRYGVS
jgi:hypothetical protein